MVSWGGTSSVTVIGPAGAAEKIPWWLDAGFRSECCRSTGGAVRENRCFHEEYTCGVSPPR